eukprot:s487_g11.t1
MNYEETLHYMNYEETLRYIVKYGIGFHLFTAVQMENAKKSSSTCVTADPQRDRFRPYYVPGLVGLMYFHWLDTVDMMNQWLDPQYWEHVVVDLPDQAWTIADVRLTGLFMSSMALFMITLHNKGVLTGGKNTLITVLFTIFVPALFLTGTHATLQASFP